MFPRIGRNVSLKQEVAEHIKDLIKTGKLNPGDRLPTERDMSEMLGVSRTVIRDAIKTLSGVGILEVKHGVGTFVATVDGDIIARQLSTLLFNDSDTIENLFEVRMKLETAAVGWAAERINDDAKEKINDFIKESLQLLESDCDNKHYIQHDQEFHSLIAVLSGNPVVVRLMRSLLDLLDETRIHTLKIPGRFDLSVKEHIRILEEIYKGDQDKATKMMNNHLVSVYESIKNK